MQVMQCAGNAVCSCCSIQVMQCAGVKGRGLLLFGQSAVGVVWPVACWGGPGGRFQGLRKTPTWHPFSNNVPMGPCGLSEPALYIALLAVWHFIPRANPAWHALVLFHVCQFCRTQSMRHFVERMKFPPSIVDLLFIKCPCCASHKPVCGRLEAS